MSILLTTANAAISMPWISTKELPGLRPATADERTAIAELLKGRTIRHDFADNEFLVHEGDLHVAGHFKSTGLLLVRGDLRVDGVYDDDIDLPYGIVAVLGNMQAQHIYSLASLYVRGDVRVDGVIAMIYNDFTFEVGGKVHAAGLVVADKATDYQPGELGFLLDEKYRNEDELDAPLRARFENGLRRLRPEFISSPRFRNPVEDGDSAILQSVDHEALRKAMHEGRPLLRSTPAPAELLHWLETAFDFETDEASLLALIGKDPLLDQLMAAREELSPTVAEALARHGDPIVLEWLTETHPKIAQAYAGEGLQPGVARRLAAEPATDEATLERIARSADPEVRAALSQRKDPPPVLIGLLAHDPEPAVRKAMLTDGFNVLALEPAALAGLIESADSALGNALAHASLSVDEVEALLPRIDSTGQIHLAESLWRQSLGVQPARMSAEQRVKLIDRLLSTSGIDGKARAYAFVALDGAQQSARIEQLQQGEVDDRVVMRLGAPEFADNLLDLADNGGRVAIELGSNRGLSPARQRRLLEVSLEAPEQDRAEAVVALADNAFLDPDVAVSLVDHALKLGLNTRADLLDCLLRRQDLPKPAIDALVARFGYVEDVVLSLLNQAHADAEQIKRTIERWYRGAVGREAAALAVLHGEAYFRALAQARSFELREVAAGNRATPVELIPQLLADEALDVAYAAAQQPSASAEQIAELDGTIEVWRDAWDAPALSAEAWHAIAARQTGLGTRLRAMEWAALAELESRRRAQP